MRPIVNVSEDPATDTGNMHKKLVKIARVFPEIHVSVGQTDPETDTHHNTSQPLPRAK